MGQKIWKNQFEWRLQQWELCGSTSSQDSWLLLLPVFSLDWRLENISMNILTWGTNFNFFSRNLHKEDTEMFKTKGKIVLYCCFLINVKTRNCLKTGNDITAKITEFLRAAVWADCLGNDEQDWDSYCGFRNNTKMCGVLWSREEKAARSLRGNRLVFRGKQSHSNNNDNNCKENTR